MRYGFFRRTRRTLPTDALGVVVDMRDKGGRRISDAFVALFETMLTLEEGQQVRIDYVGMGGGHAMREALVSDWNWLGWRPANAARSMSARYRLT